MCLYHSCHLINLPRLIECLTGHEKSSYIQKIINGMSPNYTDVCRNSGTATDILDNLLVLRNDVFSREDDYA